jgi:nitronate monooxygenase
MPTSMSRIRERTGSFCARFQLEAPILLAPMSGVPAPELSVAVARAGGMGACGVLLMSPAEIAAWASQVRPLGGGAFQLNTWIPDPPPQRDQGHEADVRAFLSAWGPPVPAQAGDARPPQFDLQCEAMLAANPPVVSSVMGLFPAPFIRNLKQRGIAWFANVSTVAEARAAEAAGADVIVVQGMEAGGHRACFEAREAERRQVGLMALLPAANDVRRMQAWAGQAAALARAEPASQVVAQLWDGARELLEE